MPNTVYILNLKGVQFSRNSDGIWSYYIPSVAYTFGLFEESEKGSRSYFHLTSQARSEFFMFLGGFCVDTLKDCAESYGDDVELVIPFK